MKKLLQSALCRAGLCLAIAAPGVAQDSSGSSIVARNALIGDVIVAVAPSGETSIRISVDGPVKCRLLRLNQPLRLALDFERAKITPMPKVIPARSPLLLRVRRDQFRDSNPAVARVVADLLSDPIVEVREQPGGIRIDLKPRQATSQAGPASTTSTSPLQENVSTTSGQASAASLGAKAAETQPAAVKREGKYWRPAIKLPASSQPTEATLTPTAAAPLPSQALKSAATSPAPLVGEPRNPPPTQAASTGAAAPSLQVLGYTEMPGGERRAYLSEGDQLYMVREGESFAGRYRLLKLGPNLIEVENLDSRTTTRLHFSQAAGVVSTTETPALERLVARLEELERRFTSLEKKVGTFLALSSPLTALPLPSRALRRLDELLFEFGFSSQTVQNLAFTDGDDLYLTRSKGSGSRKIERIQGLPAWPRWSAEGHATGLILTEPVLNATLFQDLANSGGRLRALAANGDKTLPETNYSLALPGRAGLTAEWVVHDAAGVIPKAGIRPAPLPEGQTSAVGLVPAKDGGISVVLVALPRGELARYDLKSHDFAPYLPGISAEGMDFSRDGEWLAYVSYPEGTLWRARADGTDRLPLTSSALRASSPRWSPDGKQIVFSGTSAGAPWSLYLIARDGGAPQRLTTGEHNEGDANWSPDGGALMFSTMYGLGGATAIYTLDLKSKQITLVPGSEDLYGPRWSLDGRYVVASTVRSRKLMLYDFGSKTWTEMASLAANWKAWSRDGSSVYFDVSSAVDPSIYRLRLSDRKLERVVGLKGFRRLPAFGMWFTLAPDDAPILARETDAQEIYALDW